MSLDRNDFSQETQQAQFGDTQRFWPISINPPGVGVEFEVNMNPCDHIWLPTFFDSSLGLNPCQISTGNVLGDGLVFFPWSGPVGAATMRASAAMTSTFPNNLALPGMNAFDVSDASQGCDAGYGLSTQQVFLSQAAAVYAFRFNSVNSPWLLWTLSNMLSNCTYSTQSGIKGGQVGTGDAMRAISGPISKMWARLVMPAVGQDVLTGIQAPGSPYNHPTPTIAGSRLLLLSTLGYSQQTCVSAQNSLNILPASASTVAGPQALAGPSLSTISGGGYKTTDLNTLETTALERMGFGTRRRP